ncbi:hypothetical protein IE53DRAFT_389135 [Violaceomyces palustris]|uniref:Uncharacterized protein n=1 Tax=Violaceomyces palustris TaxID=1673888 RepID=A0ACD0NS68_9BASI|nr:hypothetical protein IE53DRAFT_389135 [Violaceomyces palustris]
MFARSVSLSLPLSLFLFRHFHFPTSLAFTSFFSIHADYPQLRLLSLSLSLNGTFSAGHEVEPKGWDEEDKKASQNTTSSQEG